MLTQAQLGQRIEYKDKWWTVVRIVSSSSLHKHDTTYFNLQETFLELRCDGEVDFLVLSSTQERLDDIQSAVALPSLPWRKETNNG